MFTKLTISLLATTGLISTTALTGMVPTGAELAAGPVRIEAGNGHIAQAYLSKHSPFHLRLDLKNHQSLIIEF